MDKDLELLNGQKVALYRVFYVAYRFLSLGSLTVLGGRGLLDWLSEGKSPLALVALIVSVGYWSVVLWSCPDLLSGQWERRLPEYAVHRRPSLMLLPIFALVFVGMLLFHAVLLLFMVLVLIPSLWQVLYFIVVTGSLLVTVPYTIGMLRLYRHMRTSNAARFGG